MIPILQNRNVWAAGSLIGILLFTSGHMFNTIRKVPYIAGDGKGGISYFAGGFQNQYGMETQIVAAMCMLLFCRPNLRSLLLTLNRRHPLLRRYLARRQGTQNQRPKEPADDGPGLVCSPVSHVQLLAERLPHQERWISFLVAAILLSAIAQLGNVKRGHLQWTAPVTRHGSQLHWVWPGKANMYEYVKRVWRQ
jgi:hypothetical protein